MTEFGKELILYGEVKYVGDGEDPCNCPYMQAFLSAIKEIEKENW